MKNLFIVIDGMDGTGKSTQLSHLHNYLFKYDKRIRILTTREPTYGKTGKDIRKMLADHKDPYSDAEKLLDLYVQDRKDHVEGLINPFLKKDGDNWSIVLCDRYYYSTIAYQTAQGLDLKKSIALNKKFPKPDLTILLDIHPETALKRIAKERNQEKFEKLEFMKKLREIFHMLKDLLPDKIVLVDSSKSEHETFDHIKHQVDKIL